MTAIRKPEVAQRMAALGLIGPLGAADFRKLLDREAERWPILVDKMGIKEN